MPGDSLAPLESALDQVAAQNRTVEIWLRDDDAIARTPALERLAGMARRFGLPVLLAVIPGAAEPSLVDVLAGEPLLTPTQHGYLHANHAGPGQRACELGGDRTLQAVFDDVERGRQRMTALFGGRAASILVPPWNRITPDIVGHLPRLGFAALSAFADAHATRTDLPVRNCDLDIIDWRGGGRSHSMAKLVGRLSTLVAQGTRIGLLSHHLAHDDRAWDTLERMLGCLDRHPAARFIAIPDTL